MNSGDARQISVRLSDIAHAHAGDKGNRSNISVIPYKPESYEYLLKELTESRVAGHFSHRNPVSVTRYRLDNLPALNFVIDQVLEGGVNKSLGLDGHGQSLSFFILSMEIPVAEALILK